MGAFQIRGGVPLSSGNLVAAYNFDEGSGTTVTDRSGAGNLGTLSGPTRNTTGKYGGSLTFDGVDDYVDFGDVSAAEGSTKLSVSYWVKPQTLTTRDMHISKWKHIAAEPNTENVWAVRTQNTATDEVYIFIGNGNDAGNNYFWSTDLDLPAGAWTHLSFVYDGAGAVDADRLKLYKNGAQVSGRFTGTIPATMNSGARSVSIAQLTEGNGYFPGSIDDVRIYNRVLTPSEVTTDMNTAIGGAPPSPPPPAFAVGDGIQTAKNVNVRASGSLSATILGTQPTGSRGRIIGGPASADRITWWQMDYDNAPDGWSGQDHFTK